MFVLNVKTKIFERETEYTNIPHNLAMLQYINDGNCF